MIRDRITDRSRNTRLVAKPRFTMISACHKPLRYLKADQHTEHCFLTELALYIHALRTEAYHEEQHHKPTAHACEQGLPQKKERIDFFYTLFFSPVSLYRFTPTHLREKTTLLFRFPVWLP